MNVSLRPLEDRDLDTIYQQVTDPESIRMAAFTSEDQADRRAFLNRMSRLRAGTNNSYRVIDVDGAVAGTIGSFRLDNQLEVTYWVDRTQWGKGIASAALQILLAETAERPVYARAASDNVGSLRVLEKAGFRRVGVNRDFAPGRGEEIEETILRLDSGRTDTPVAGYDRRSQRPATRGASVSDKSNWQVARLEDIERRGRDIPVREHLGIHAFGINAFTPGEDGTVISEHDEAGSGQEELYIVLDGNATFEVDGDTIDARAGTFVVVGPESRRRATGDATILAVGGTPGEAYQGIDWGEAWPFHSESMNAYGEQRYADALEAVRGALERMPDHAGLNYNYACFATLAGETGDDTFAHLRRSVELLPRFREDARRDDDFATVRDDPRFEEALR